MTITCADCGTIQTIPVLPDRGTARCYRCDRVLDRHVGKRTDVVLACTIATLVLLPPAGFSPLMSSSLKSLLFEQSRLITSVGTMYAEVWFPFAFGFLFFALLFPWLHALLLLVVIARVRWNVAIPQAGRIFRFSEELRNWSMTEVVVIAGAIAYFRADIDADVTVQFGAWAYLVVAVLSFVSDRTLDRRAIWNAILRDRDQPPNEPWVSCSVCEMVVTSRQSGDPCPRCGGTLDRDVAKRFAPALGAVAAAIPLCFPAYTFSIMVNDQLTAVLEQTIMGTIQLLADRGYWWIGVIVLIAGIVVPVGELLALTWLLLRTRFPKRRGLLLRTKAYRVLVRLVRWPMIIPFIAALAAPIVSFRGIDDIVAGPGATPLFAVIALTMLAVRLFEPRLMWKTAGASL